MRSGDLLAILQECYVEKLALRQRHVAVARRVTDYDFNNTYQYVIAREDVHLAWLAAAIADLGGTPEDRPEPDLPPPGKKTDFLPLVRDDGKQAEAFVTRWRVRLPDIGHARHRGMIQVILGETLEHKRFFDQIVAGREDVLGRRANGPGSPGTGDGVLPVRWMD
jgi:hypothetical protein